MADAKMLDRTLIIFARPARDGYWKVVIEGTDGESSVSMQVAKADLPATLAANFVGFGHDLRGIIRSGALD